MSITERNKVSHSFWKKLPKPFFALAPMADVTDSVFRQIVAENGKPDVFFTEFTSTDGLANEAGRKRLITNLNFTKVERPIVAQLFGRRPENIFKAACFCKELGFNGVDINMGCPQKKIEKTGAGAVLMKKENHPLAGEIIAAAQSAGLPVSVKTRLGYSSVNEFGPWLEVLLRSRPAAITVHLRTRNEMSRVPAHWELCHLVTRPPIGGRVTKLIANGDLKTLAEAREKAERYQLDGVMIGRAVWHNPWFFSGKEKEEIPFAERMRVLLRHAELFEKTYLETRFPSNNRPLKNFAQMRKFFGPFVSGHPKARLLRQALMKCENSGEVERVVKKYLC